jgi:hypothetical protein
MNNLKLLSAAVSCLKKEISLSFTCNNRAAAAATSGGWMLGIHDLNGELQETYPVKPEDCVISDTTLGAFNFRFPSLDSPTYFVSVVSDCAAPIYNTTVNPKDPTKNIVNVNKFVTVATAKQTDIDVAKAELLVAQKAIDETKTVLDLANKGQLLISQSPDIYAPSSLHINSNANIQKLTDALALANDITNFASTALTPATNITAAISTAKAIEIAASTMGHVTFTFGQFLFAEAAANNLSVQADIDAADILVMNTTEALKKAQEDKAADDKKVSDSQVANQAAYDKEVAAYDKEVAANQADYDKQLAAYEKEVAANQANYEKELAAYEKEVAANQASYEKEVAANQAIYDAALKAAQAVFDKANTDYIDALTLLTTNNSQETQSLVRITEGFRTKAETELTELKKKDPKLTGFKVAPTKPTLKTVSTTKPTLKTAPTKPIKSTADVFKPDANVVAALAIATRNKENAETAKKTAENTKKMLDKNLTDATFKYTEAKTKLDEALTALENAVKSLNETVKANIDAANTAENLVKRFDSDACKNYNTGIYTLKDNPDNEIKRLEDITSKEQKNLGLEQSGQISSIDDNDIYVVDSDGTTDVPLLFTCNALAIRQSNNWKLSIFNDANGLVNSTLINGSTCGSVFVGDKGGYSFKLPKGSQRYYLAVESACASSTKKDCVVDTSEYSILRDVDKVYSGRLTAKNTKITATSADLTLTNCGLNNKAVISIKAENVDLAAASKLTKLPVNVQIGSTACRILTPDLATKDVIVGSVSDTSEITDSQSTAKDSAKITLGECGADGSKVTISGSKLDFANFNPNNAIESVVIPVKVSIGDFACETKEVFYSQNKGTEIAAGNTTSTTTTESTDENIAALSKAKNVGTSQTNQIKVATDIQTYFVESSTTANFEFSCPNSNRFTNDWILLTYDSAKKLQATKSD